MRVLQEPEIELDGGGIVIRGGVFDMEGGDVDLGTLVGDILLPALEGTSDE